MNNLFARILENKRREVECLKKRLPLAALLEAAHDRGPTRSLTSALLADNPAVKVIAEIKRSSPTKAFRPVDFDPVQIAKDYESAGAVAISVLTDARFFSGSPEYLPMVRDAVKIPVLRKDFIIDPWQVAQTAALGADAILLMAVNFPDTGSIAVLYNQAVELGIEPLVEIHTPEQWAMVEPLKPKLVGINNRDFLSENLAVDTDATARMAPALPKDAAVISESGVSSKDDVEKLLPSGIDGFLIGSALMSQSNPGAALKALTTR